MSGLISQEKRFLQMNIIYYNSFIAWNRPEYFTILGRNLLFINLDNDACHHAMDEIQMI